MWEKSSSIEKNDMLNMLNNSLNDVVNEYLERDDQSWQDVDL